MSEEQPKKFIDRIADKLETALANVLVWGSAIVVAWAVGYVYVGKGEITDVHNDAVQRDAEISGSVEALSKDMAAIRKILEEMKKDKKDIVRKPPTARTEPIDDDRMIQQSASYDYVKEHSRKYSK